MRVPNPFKRMAKILTLSAFIAAAFMCCKKAPGNKYTQPEVYAVSVPLKESFAFRPGSYWIYRDPLTGDIDSAYVEYYLDTLYHVGCVKSPIMREYIFMNIRRSSVAHGTVDTNSDRVWMFELSDSIIKMRSWDERDSIARYQFLTLTQYPFATKLYYGNSGGCALFGYADSGYVAEVIPSLTINGNVYSNTAVSAHTDMNNGSATAYNDVMYLSPQVGLVRVDIDHPLSGLRRIWELQRYHIAR